MSVQFIVKEQKHQLRDGRGGGKCHGNYANTL